MKAECYPFGRPHMQIIYYRDNTMVKHMKDFSDDLNELEIITAGKYNWIGFTGLSFEAPTANIRTDGGDD